MRAWALPVALLLALAGCGEAPPPAAPPPATASVQGWVVDAARAPVAGANVTLAGLGVTASTDAQGHYALDAPAGSDLLVTVTAPGFLPASQAVGAYGGAGHVLNFTLRRAPDAAPYHVVSSFDGVLRCGVVAVVTEDPGRPHQHQGVRCSTLLEDARNAWRMPIPPNATGIVVEAQWEPQTPFSGAMVMSIVVEGSGDVLGFVEGMSILRVQLSQAKLAHNLQAGHSELNISLEAGAGMGSHEHGAVGAFHEQAFALYATAFFNGPADPSYSVGRSPP